MTPEQRATAFMSLWFGKRWEEDEHLRDAWSDLLGRFHELMGQVERSRGCPHGFANADYCGICQLEENSNDPT